MYFYFGILVDGCDVVQYDGCESLSADYENWAFGNIDFYRLNTDTRKLQVATDVVDNTVVWEDKVND